MKRLLMLIRKPLNLSLVSILLLATSTGITFAQTLRQQANQSGMLVGAAVNPSLFAEGVYAATLTREFNMVEPENMMKWGAIRPDRNTFTSSLAIKWSTSQRHTR